MAIAAIVLFVCACDDDVAGPSGVDEPYSMYGIMNPRLETQTLLVGPTISSLEDYDDVIDASVTSTELSTGKEYVWRDSVVDGARGQIDHVFTARFRPEFGSRHHIVVRRSDGEISDVEVAVPGRVSFETLDERTRAFGVRVNGEDVRLISAEVTYGVRLYAPLAMTPAGMCLSQPRSYFTLPLETREMSGGDWMMEWDLREQLFLIRSYYAQKHRVQFRPEKKAQIALMEMDLEITVGGPSWNPPGGEFDRHVLSAPQAMTNISNGLGFVGAGYNQEREHWPSEESVSDAWVYDFLMRPPGECRDFCSCGLGS